MMTRRKRGPRLYEKRGRWYANLRDFEDVGGKLEAMRPVGSRYATTDRDEAVKVLVKRHEELVERRRARQRGREGGLRDDQTLREFAERHLRLEADSLRPSTVARAERALRMVLGWYGEGVRLSEIDAASLADYVSHRRRQPGVHEGTRIQPQTILHELSALSSLFERAVTEDVAPENPVRKLHSKPKVDRDEAVWLEVGEAARLLRVAGEMDRAPAPRSVPYLKPIFAVPLLTSARKSEVLGLEVRDVDFQNGAVHIRPNRWRRLKTKRSNRRVPLWPQLRDILREHIDAFGLTGNDLLFPSKDGGMLDDLRGSLASAVAKAEVTGKRVTFITLRHTYASTRIQTLDRGEPVSVFTVAREMGHKGTNLIEDTYGHLQNDRNRSEAVEYREATVVSLEERRAAKGA
jgi:integrase